MENGSSCNLGYNLQLIWIPESGKLVEVEDNDEMRNHQNDFKLIDASDNCKLICVIVEDKQFIPQHKYKVPEDK